MDVEGEPANPDDTETISCESDDAAFILGKGGMTKHKIANVSGAHIDLDEKNLVITIRGTEVQRQRAREYIGFVTQQRTGQVEVGVDSGRDDLTIVRVPSDCVAFVMGRGGQTLRMIEAEWGTLMFFAQGFGSANVEESDQEMLMIFGPLRARRGAELKVMSAVEHKVPGTFTNGEQLLFPERLRGDEPPEGWDLDTILLDGSEFSYALGSGGSTRKKLAAASGCILEYVGRLACMCGYRDDRRRAGDYLKWLLTQRNGPVAVDPAGRDDVVVVAVPKESIGFVTGTKGEALRQVEKATGTFCFINAIEGPSGATTGEQLLVFSRDDAARERAERMLLDKIDERKRGGTSHDYGSGGGRGGHDDRQMCFDFQVGRCTRGGTCKFSHGGPAGPRGYDDYNRRRDRDEDRGRGDYDDRRRDRYDDRYDDRRRDRYDDRYDDRRSGYDDRRRYDDRRGGYDDRRGVYGGGGAGGGGYGGSSYDERRHGNGYDDRYDDRRRSGGFGGGGYREYDGYRR